MSKKEQVFDFFQTKPLTTISSLTKEFPNIKPATLRRYSSEFRKKYQPTMSRRQQVFILLEEQPAMDLKTMKTLLPEVKPRTLETYRYDFLSQQKDRRLSLPRMEGLNTKEFREVRRVVELILAGFGPGK